MFSRSLIRLSSAVISAVLLACVASVAHAAAPPTQEPVFMSKTNVTTTRDDAAPDASLAQEHPYLRVDTAGIDVQVHSAGATWAGRSEVPLATLTPDQVKTLKADDRLEVTEISRPHIAPG